jgi:hypothetical protein
MTHKFVHLSEKSLKTVLDWSTKYDETPLGRAYIGVCCGIADLEINAADEQLKTIYPKGRNKYFVALRATRELLIQARDTLGREILAYIKRQSKS